MASDSPCLLLHLRYRLDSGVVVPDSTSSTSHGQDRPTPSQGRNILGRGPRQGGLLRLHVPELDVSLASPESHYLRLELGIAFQGANAPSVLGKLAKLGDLVVVIRRYILVVNAVPPREERDIVQATTKESRRSLVRIVGR